MAAAALWTRTYASIAVGVPAAVIANRRRGIAADRRWRATIRVMALDAVGMAMGFDCELPALFCAAGTVLLLAIRSGQHRWGALAGGISYPLYLNSWIAVFLVNAVSPSAGWIKGGVGYWAIVAASSLALATVLYWYFDRRILAGRKRFYTPGRAQVIMIVAYSTLALGISAGLILRGRG